VAGLRRHVDCLPETGRNANATCGKLPRKGKIMRFHSPHCSKEALSTPSERRAPPVSTPEQRANARAALAARRAACTLRRDFLDAGEWDCLAQAAGIRLPQWHQAPTPGAVERWLRRLGVSFASYREYSGDTTLATFSRLNPDWPLRAWVGMLLEGLSAGILPARVTGRRQSDVSTL